MSQFLPNPAIKDTPFGALEAADYGNYFPIGMIISWTGTYGQVPNGWLICHGQDLRGYETDLPRLHQMIPDYHGVGFFHTPDFRGRSPMGAHIGPGASPQAPVRDIPLGARLGDWRIPYHRHYLAPQGSGGGYPSIAFADNTGDINAASTALTTNPKMDAADANGTGSNLPPVTGVNFLIYCGQDTSAIKDRDDLGSVSAVTTRMMIESRLAEAGVDPEEAKMLKEQLEALKTAEAERHNVKGG